MPGHHLIDYFENISSHDSLLGKLQSRPDNVAPYLKKLALVNCKTYELWKHFFSVSVL